LAFPFKSPIAWSFLLCAALTRVKTRFTLVNADTRLLSIKKYLILIYFQAIPSMLNTWNNCNFLQTSCQFYLKQLLWLHSPVPENRAIQIKDILIPSCINKIFSMSRENEQHINTFTLINKNILKPS